MHFPLFIDLKDRSCLVVGGGRIAVRKVSALVEFGARVTVVAATVDPAIARETRCAVRRRNFEDADLEGQTLVVVATDDSGVNARVSRLCRERGIPVNAVDDPANCTFIFPAWVRRGPLVAAVSSGGACPVAAKLVRDRISGILTDDFTAAVEELGAAREELKRRFPDPEDRRRHCEEKLEKWNV